PTYFTFLPSAKSNKYSNAYFQGPWFLGSSCTHRISFTFGYLEIISDNFSDGNGYNCSTRKMCVLSKPSPSFTCSAKSIVTRPEPNKIRSTFFGLVPNPGCSITSWNLPSDRSSIDAAAN